MLLEVTSAKLEDSRRVPLAVRPANEDFFISSPATSPDRLVRDNGLSVKPQIHLQVAECGSPDNCNITDDSESLPLEELFTKILEIKKQRDEEEASDHESFSPNRSNRAALSGFESVPEKDASNKSLRSSSKRHVGSSHNSGFRSLLRKIKRLFHIPFRKSSKKKKSSTMESEDKHNAQSLTHVFQKTMDQSGGRASVNCPIDAARISSSFSIPLSFHNHDREAQIFPFPFPPPFALSDLEPAVLANYLTALDSVSVRGSPDIGLISPLSFDTRAPEENHVGGSKAQDRAKSGPQFQRHRSLMKSIKRAQSFSALPPESIEEVPYSHRVNVSSYSYSSMDLGNRETGRAGWRKGASEETSPYDECAPDLFQQNTPRHLRTASHFSITFDIHRVQSKKSKKREKQEDMENEMVGGSGQSDNSDSGTVEEVVHGLEESNFTTSPVASTFVFDKSLNTSLRSCEGDDTPYANSSFAVSHLEEDFSIFLSEEIYPQTASLMHRPAGEIRSPQNVLSGYVSQVPEIF